MVAIAALILIASLPASPRFLGRFLLVFFVIRATPINVVPEILTLISYIGSRSVKRLAFFGVFHLNLPVIEWGLAVHLLNGVLSFIRLSVSYVSKSS